MLVLRGAARTLPDARLVYFEAREGAVEMVLAQRWVHDHAHSGLRCRKCGEDIGGPDEGNSFFPRPTTCCIGARRLLVEPREASKAS